MKGLDVFIVRFLPFILYVIFGSNLVCLYHKIDITIFFELHGQSALYALALYFISLSNKKYHCKWNRAMYLYLIFVPVFNFLDISFGFYPTQEEALVVLLHAFGITAIITAFLAIRHFIQMSKRRLEHGGE